MDTGNKQKYTWEALELLFNLFNYYKCFYGFCETGSDFNM